MIHPLTYYIYINIYVIQVKTSSKNFKKRIKAREIQTSTSRKIKQNKAFWNFFDKLFFFLFVFHFEFQAKPGFPGG